MMTSTASDQARLHELFPTPEEIRANPELMLSDHLPIMAELTFNDGHPPLTQHTKFNVLSWNVLAPNGANGVLGNLEDADQWEHPGQSTARYKRIAQALKKAVLELKIDVICLQEARMDCLEAPLKEAFKGMQWEIASQEKSLITCYLRRHELLSETLDNSTDQESIYSSLFRTQNKGGETFTVEVHNVHGDFNYFPRQKEQVYGDLLRRSQADLAVLAGDTNSRVAPCHGTRQNIVTGLVPRAFIPKWLSQGSQYPDYPDLIAVKHNGDPIQQADINVVNPYTGKVHAPGLNRDRFLQHGEALRVEFQEYRPVLCLDAQQYAVMSKELFGDEITLSEFEQELRQDFGRDDIEVYHTARADNARGIMVRFPIDYKATVDKFEQCENVVSLPDDDDETASVESLHSFNTDQTIQFKRGIDSSNACSQVYHCIMIPVERLNDFHACLRQFRSDAKEQIAAYFKLDGEKEKLTSRLSNSFFKSNTVGKYKAEVLEALINKIFVNSPGSQTPSEIKQIIIDWELEKSGIRAKGEEENLTHRALLRQCRNNFFSATEPAEGKLTSSEEVLEEVKSDLERANIERQEAVSQTHSPNPSRSDGE